MSTVFCIHGLGRGKGNPTVFVPLVEHIHKKSPSATVFSATYDNSLVGRAHDIANDLIKQIQGKLSDPKQPVILIGHSNGGVLSFVINFLKNDLNVRMVATVASPLSGTLFADTILPFASSNIQGNLGKGSKLISDYNSEFGKELGIEDPFSLNKAELSKQVVTLAKKPIDLVARIRQNPSSVLLPAISMVVNLGVSTLNKGKQAQVFDNQRKRKAEDLEDKTVKKTKYFIGGGVNDFVVPLEDSVPEKLRNLKHPNLVTYIDESCRGHSHVVSSPKMMEAIYQFIKSELPFPSVSTVLNNNKRGTSSKWARLLDGTFDVVCKANKV